MSERMNDKYPLKVWLYTLLGAPLMFATILWVYSGYHLSDFFAAWPLALAMMVMSCLLSLPSLWLYWLLFKELSYNKKPVWVNKVWLSAAGISLIWITLYLTYHDSFSEGDPDVYMIAGVYSLILLTTSFLVKMKQTNYSYTATGQSNHIQPENG